MIASIKDLFSQFIEPGITAISNGNHQAMQVATAALLLEMMRMDNELKDVERQAIAGALQAQFSFDASQGLDMLPLLTSWITHQANSDTKSKNHVPQSKTCQHQNNG